MCECERRTAAATQRSAAPPGAAGSGAASGLGSVGNGPRVTPYPPDGSQCSQSSHVPMLSCSYACSFCQPASGQAGLGKAAMPRRAGEALKPETPRLLELGSLNLRREVGER